MTTLTHQDRMHLIGLIRNGDHPKNIGNENTDKGRDLRRFAQTWEAARRLAHVGGFGQSAKKLTSLVYPDRVEVYDTDQSCDIPLIIAGLNEAMMALMRGAQLFPVAAKDEDRCEPDGACSHRRDGVDPHALWGVVDSERETRREALDSLAAMTAERDELLKALSTVADAVTGRRVWKGDVPGDVATSIIAEIKKVRQDLILLKVSNDIMSDWPEPRHELNAEIARPYKKWVRAHEGSAFSDVFDPQSIVPIGVAEDWLNSGTPLDYTASTALLREIEWMRAETAEGIEPRGMGMGAGVTSRAPMPGRIRVTVTIECPCTGVHTESREIDPGGLVPVPKVGAAAREMAKSVPATFAEAWRSMRTHDGGAANTVAAEDYAVAMDTPMGTPLDYMDTPMGTAFLTKPENLSHGSMHPRERFIEALSPPEPRDPAECMGDHALPEIVNPEGDDQ